MRTEVAATSAPDWDEKPGGSAATAVPPVLVLGLGNLLLRDDGVGLELMRQLEARQSEHGGAVEVEYVDGGTQGVALLGHLEERRALLVLDAVSVDSNGPGEIAVVRDPLAHPSAQGMGAHGANASGLLASAQLLGQLPPRAVVVGIGPAELETGIGLSRCVSAVLPEALARAEEVLGELCQAVERERSVGEGAAPCTS